MQASEAVWTNRLKRNPRSTISGASLQGGCGKRIETEPCNLGQSFATGAHHPPLLRLGVHLSRLRLLLLCLSRIIRILRLCLPAMSSSYKLCVLSGCDSCQASVVAQGIEPPLMYPSYSQVFIQFIHGHSQRAPLLQTSPPLSKHDWANVQDTALSSREVVRKTLEMETCCFCFKLFVQS